MVCNIVTFRFTCQHMVRRPRSRCGGTKHKITSTSIKAACIAESFLAIHLHFECGPCQHKAWEDAWQLKLDRASTFLKKLGERCLPGLVEIGALVKSLEAEYATASWNTRNMFVQASKPSITRVKHKHYEKAVSKLSQELHPEDIIESTGKNWTDMDDDDYDGDYIASTDPIHPVSTDYSHPSDDEDRDWILQHLSPEPPECRAYTDLHPDLDFRNNSGWNWTDDSRGSDAGLAMNEYQAENSSSDKDGETTQQARNLVAWGPDIADSPSIGMLHLTEEIEHETRVKQVIEAFWSVVNCDHPLRKPQSPRSSTTATTNTPDHFLHDLSIIDPSLMS